MFSIYQFFIVALLILYSETHFREPKFKLLYEWKQIEYKFRSEEERSEAIANGTFNPGYLQPIDAQYTYSANTHKERIFISVPRLDPQGYPATLGAITKETRDGNPIIDPYPSWSWQINPRECRPHRIVSVFRVWADECNRLWVMDDGIVGEDFVCPPQILAFDLNTDKLLHQYELPYNQYQNTSWYVAPIAEVEDCKNTWVYVADPVGQSLLVYSLKQNTSWVIHDKSFKNDPNYNDYTIQGNKFSISDGIITVALSPRSDGPQKRKLHYHAMSNIKESWVYTKDLKQPTNFMSPYGAPQLFHTYEDERDQQSATEAVDKHGNLYFSLLIDVKLVKWNPKTRYVDENFKVLAKDKETMQFPSGLKISPYKGGSTEVLWMFATAYQQWGAGVLNGNKTNFRLFAAIL